MELSDTIQDVKQKIQLIQDRMGIPRDQLHMKWRGRNLEEEHTLKFYLGHDANDAKAGREPFTFTLLRGAIHHATPPPTNPSEENERLGGGAWWFRWVLVKLRSGVATENKSVEEQKTVFDGSLWP